jgi:cyclic pyranopterin monophosphate synthase
MPEPGKGLTHLDADGNAKMVDVGDKAHSVRQASARATVLMTPATLSLIEKGSMKKGDVLTVAKIAGIQAAKKCSELIPLCHPLALSGIDVDFEFDPDNSSILISTSCRLTGQTGVEMEALTTAAVAALTIYDMCKSVDRDMSITNIELVTKSGGKSGEWQREEKP